MFWWWRAIDVKDVLRDATIVSYARKKGYRTRYFIYSIVFMAIVTPGRATK